MLTGQNGILNRASEAKEKTEIAQKDEKNELNNYEDIINDYITGNKVEKVSDAAPGKLEIGENDNVFIINSIEDLVFFSYDVTEGNTYEGKTVKLGLSLDFNSNKSYVDAHRKDYDIYGYSGELKNLLTNDLGFNPIGTMSNINIDGYSFAGTFDGNGNSIFNLYINKSKNKNEEMRVGFFANSKGTIKNLNIINGNVKLNMTGKTGDVGGIASKNFGVIENCMYVGDVGIYAKDEVTGLIRIGGIVSGNADTMKNSCHIGNVYVIDEASYENVTHYMGGLASGNQGIIENCYSDGKINSNKINYVGGIVGANASGSKILNCYNKKEVVGDHGVGGIAGYNEDNAEIENCYNVGVINGSETSFCGNIIALARGKIINCYYIKSNKNVGSMGSNAGIISSSIVEKSAEEMKDAEIISLLNQGKNIWKKDTNLKNNGYPILYWE